MGRPGYEATKVCFGLCRLFESTFDPLVEISVYMHRVQKVSPRDFGSCECSGSPHAMERASCLAGKNVG